MLQADFDEHIIEAGGPDQVKTLSDAMRQVGLSGSDVYDEYYRTLTADHPGTASVSLRFLDREALSALRQTFELRGEKLAVMVIDKHLGIKRDGKVSSKGALSGDTSTFTEEDAPTDPNLVDAARITCVCGEEHLIRTHRADLREEDVTITCSCGHESVVSVSPASRASIQGSGQSD